MHHIQRHAVLTYVWCCIRMLAVQLPGTKSGFFPGIMRKRSSRLQAAGEPAQAAAIATATRAAAAGAEDATPTLLLPQQQEPTEPAIEPGSNTVLQHTGQQRQQASAQPDIQVWQSA